VSSEHLKSPLLHLFVDRIQLHPDVYWLGKDQRKIGHLIPVTDKNLKFLKETPLYWSGYVEVYDESITKRESRNAMIAGIREFHQNPLRVVYSGQKPYNVIFNDDRDLREHQQIVFHSGEKVVPVESAKPFLDEIWRSVMDEERKRMLEIFSRPFFKDEKSHPVEESYPVKNLVANQVHTGSLQCPACRKPDAVLRSDERSCWKCGWRRA